MPDNYDKSVLASRVLSFLKRSLSDGPKPTDGEAKAAIAALTLLSTAFRAEANDPVKMFEKLKQVSRVNIGTGQSELDKTKIQLFKDRQSQMYETLSNIMKKQSETKQSMIKNLQ